MRLASRYFVLDDEDRIFRFPQEKYWRFIHGGTGLRSDRFAGKRIRNCEILILFGDDGAPIDVLQGCYGYLYFDEQGYLDRERYEEDFGLLMGVAMEAQAVVRGREHETGRKLVDARMQFNARRVRHQCRWQPARELETAIYEAARGERRGIPWVDVRDQSAPARRRAGVGA